MREGYSKQFQRPCVVVENPAELAEELITYAQGIGAVYFDGEDECVVLDLQVDKRRVGPEVYTLASVRRSFKPKSQETHI